MKAFVLQSPATCGYLNDWLYVESLRRAGVLAPRFQFVNLIIDGESWGVYALQESVPKELSVSFDAEREGRYLAHTSLWGTHNGPAWHKGNRYLNPLETHPAPAGHSLVSLAQTRADVVDLSQYDDLDTIRVYAREVMRISQPAYIEELESVYAGDLVRYRAALAQEFFHAYLEPPWDLLSRRQDLLLATLRPSQPIYAYQIDTHAGMGRSRGFGDNIQLYVGNLVAHPVVLWQVQSGERTVDIRPDWIREEGEALIDQEVEPSVVLRGLQGPAPRYIALHIPATEAGKLFSRDASLDTNTLQIRTSLFGLDARITVDVQQEAASDLTVTDLPTQPSLQQALELHPFLTVAAQPGFLELAPGTWTVEGDLILPDGFGLRATQPVTLAFDRQAILFSTGPLSLQGSGGGRIRLVPQDVDWGGIVVFQAGAETQSRFRNVDVYNTTGSRWDGRVTGGIAFYHSSVTFDHCRVLGSTAPSAVQIVRSDFVLVDSEFGYTSADAFAGDYVRGRLERCTFRRILGNGINMNHSVISVQDVNLLHVYDTGLLANMSSEVTARSIYAQDIGMAIVSKDMGYIDVKDVNIVQARMAGIGAYRAQMPPSRSTIHASEVMFQDTPVQVRAQMGSSVNVNGTIAEPYEIGAEMFVRQPRIAGAVRVLGVQLGSGIQLVGYHLEPTRYVPGESLQLVLYWQTFDELSQDYTIFVHIVDGSGNIVAQWDSKPRQNDLPTTAWRVGEIVDDLHPVPLPPDMPTGEYQILLGMYDWQSGIRVPAFGRSGEEFPNAAVVLETKIEIRQYRE
jgi:hypothetical protein